MEADFRQKFLSFSLAGSFFFFYILYLAGYSGVTFAATPTPSPPTIVDSPDPASDGWIVSVNCTGCSVADGRMKLYVCRDSTCSNCRGVSRIAPANPTLVQSSGAGIRAWATRAENGVWGFLRIVDNSNSGVAYANWTWNFGASYNGVWKIKWYANLTGDSLPSTCVDVDYGIYVSNNGVSWTEVRSGTFEHAPGGGAWSPFTPTYFDKITGTYRYVRASLKSSAACIGTAQLAVDGVRVDYERTTNCWCTSGWVTSEPSCNMKTCGVCEYSTVSYWGMIGSNQSYGFEHYVYSSITSEQTHTCKKADGCACTSNEECYNETCGPGGVCGRYPMFVSLYVLTTLDDMSVFWKTVYDKENDVNVECTFITGGQQCNPFPYSGPAGSGSCYISSPNYDMTADPGGFPRTVKNILYCKASDSIMPGIYSERVLEFYPVAFEVSVPGSVGLVVGERQDLLITVKNNGTLSDSYDVTLIPQDPGLLFVENGAQTTETLDTYEIQQIDIDVTLLSSINPTSADLSVVSNVASNIRFDKNIRFEGTDKSLPDFGVFGIAQIMIIAAILVSFLF